MGFDFDFRYEHILVFASGVGFLASLVFLFLYVTIDRPKFRDRYAGLVAGLGLVSAIGFGVPFILALFGESIDPDGDHPIWQWFVAVGVRGIASAFMCWLLWVYLTPNRARNRLGRYAPISRETHDAQHHDLAEGQGS